MDGRPEEGYCFGSIHDYPIILAVFLFFFLYIYMYTLYVLNLLKNNEYSTEYS